MRWIARLGRRLRLFIRHDRIERSMARELQDHLDAEVADRVARGLAPAEARRTALIDFGGLEATKELARDARGGRAAENVIADVRDAGRVFRRNPAFVVATSLTLGLGIGAATAVFSLVYGVLLRPLPYARPGELVALWERNVPRQKDQNVVSAENFDAWRSRGTSFSAMAALMPSAQTFADGPAPERVAGAEVSPGYFTLLGVAPELGRDLTAEDARAESAVVLSHGLWLRRFGGDAAIVGRVLLVGGRSRTVVGVMPGSFEPPAFGWLGAQQFWLPMNLTAANQAWGRYLLVVARLRSGVTVAAARSEMTALSAALSVESHANAGWSSSVVPLAEQISGDVRTSLYAILAGAALLFVMAVVNVATLTMSLMRRRSAELAVRRALGATDARLFRHLFVQSLFVGLAGSLTGLIVAIPATAALMVLLPRATPRVTSVAADGTVLGIMGGAALVTSVLLGVLSARRGRGAANRPLLTRDAGDTRTTSRAGGAMLVAAEVAIGLAVSVMAVMMVRSFVALRQVDPGFDPAGILAVRVEAPADRYPSPESQRAFFRVLVDRTRALAGVSSAAIVSARPFDGIGPATTVTDANAPNAAATSSAVADVRFVDALAPSVLGIRLLSGTSFDGATDAAGPPRVIVSASLARQLWPAGRAVGQKLRMAMFNGITPEVIGVVADIHLVDARTPARPLAMLSAEQFPDSERDLLVRTTMDPAAIAGPLRALVSDIAPGTPLYRVALLRDVVAETLAADRFTTLLLGVFAVAALCLAAIGIFGVFSADTEGRRREIGLRVALGGSAANVVWLLVQRAIRRAAVGVLAGLFLAGALGQGMRSLLFGVSAVDPASMAEVAAGMAVLTLAATLIPAFTVLRASPLRALRDD